jgi:hypothetical protein
MAAAQAGYKRAFSGWTVSQTDRPAAYAQARVGEEKVFATAA